LALPTRGIPRPSVTLTLTRDGTDGVEVLLGRRSETMRAFPGYWAFPGGGVSRSDKEATRFISNKSGAQDSAVVAVVREMSEELGVVPSGNALKPVDENLEGKDYLIGDFSGADIMLGHSCFMSNRLGCVSDEMSNIKAYVEKLENRPAFKKAIETQ